MKKIFFLVPILAFFAVSTTIAQKQNLLKLNFFSPLLQTFNFQFEHVISYNKSVQMGLFYTNYKVSDTKSKGYGLTPEFRLYDFKNAKTPNGFYAAAYFRYQNFELTANENNSKASLFTIGGGIIAGYQVLIGDAISLEAFFGPYYNYSTIKVKSGSLSDFHTSPFDSPVRGAITVGIAF